MHVVNGFHMIQFCDCYSLPLLLHLKRKLLPDIEHEKVDWWQSLSQASEIDRKSFGEFQWLLPELESPGKGMPEACWWMVSAGQRSRCRLWQDHLEYKTADWAHTLVEKYFDIDLILNLACQAILAELQSAWKCVPKCLYMRRYRTWEAKWSCTIKQRSHRDHYKQLICLLFFGGISNETQEQCTMQGGGKWVKAKVTEFKIRIYCKLQQMLNS